MKKNINNTKLSHEFFTNFWLKVGPKLRSSLINTSDYFTIRQEFCDVVEVWEGENGETASDNFFSLLEKINKIINYEKLDPLEQLSLGLAKMADALDEASSNVKKFNLDCKDLNILLAQKHLNKSDPMSLIN